MATGSALANQSCKACTDFGPDLAQAYLIEHLFLKRLSVAIHFDEQRKPFAVDPSMIPHVQSMCCWVVNDAINASF